MVRVFTQEQDHGEEAGRCHMHRGQLQGVWKTALFHQVLVEGDQACGNSPPRPQLDQLLDQGVIDLPRS